MVQYIMDTDRDIIDGLDDIARVSMLSIKIKRFLEYIETAYLFLGFMLGVVSFTYMGEAIGELLGIGVEVSASIGSLTGLTISTIMYLKYASKIFHITGNKYKKIFNASSMELITYNILMALAWMLLALLIEEVNPDALNLIWHPGVSILLPTIYMMKRDKMLKPHFIASIIMLPFTPLVIMTASVKLAVGSMLIAYYTAGLYSIRESLKIFWED